MRKFSDLHILEFSAPWNLNTSSSPSYRYKLNTVQTSSWFVSATLDPFLTRSLFCFNPLLTDLWVTQHIPLLVSSALTSPGAVRVERAGRRILRGDCVGKSDISPISHFLIFRKAGVIVARCVGIERIYQIRGDCKDPSKCVRFAWGRQL